MTKVSRGERTHPRVPFPAGVAVGLHRPGPRLGAIGRGQQAGAPGQVRKIIGD